MLYLYIEGWPNQNSDTCIVSHNLFVRTENLLSNFQVYKLFPTAVIMMCSRFSKLIFSN